MSDVDESLKRDRTGPPDKQRDGQRHAAREATRKRLLDATVASLAEHGVVAYSTSMTSEAAGVSHGTVFTHFGNRDELLAATAEQICSELTGELESFVVSPSRSNRGQVGALLDTAWELVCDPRFQVVIDLVVASRTDRELAARLSTTLDGYLDTVAKRVGAWAPDELSTVDGFDDRIRAVVASLAGIRAVESVGGPLGERQLAHTLATTILEGIPTASP